MSQTFRETLADMKPATQLQEARADASEQDRLKTAKAIKEESVDPSISSAVRYLDLIEDKYNPALRSTFSKKLAQLVKRICSKNGVSSDADKLNDWLQNTYIEDYGYDTDDLDKTTEKDVLGLIIEEVVKHAQFC